MKGNIPSILLFLLFTFCVINKVSAQQYQLTGSVKDDNSRPLEYTTVILLKTDSTVVSNALTDEKGDFLIKVAAGTYQLKLKRIGQQLYSKRIEITGDISLGTITPYKTAQELEGVVIKGRKPLIERKVDRLVFNVENSVALTGGDATDALKLTPGINADFDNITIVGKDAVRVLINDKIVQLSGADLLSYLKSIPANKIEKVEVITNPPAKYDAAGNSGLINIQLKTLPKENSWSALMSSSAEFATYPTLTNGVNFTYRKNKFSAVAGLLYKTGNKIYTNDVQYIYPSQEFWRNNIYNKNNTKNLGSLANLQYSISKNHSIGLQYSGSFTDRLTTEDNASKAYLNNQIIRDYPSAGNTSSNPSVNAINLNYTGKLDSLGTKLNIDADYFNSSSPRNNQFTSDQTDFTQQSAQFISASNISAQDIINYSLRADVEIPTKWVALNFGGKFTSTSTDNEVSFLKTTDQPILSQESQYDHFKYNENIQALYISGDKKIDDKWSFKIGLRGEYTQAKSNSISTNQIFLNKYFKIFPTLYLLYKPNANHSFNINFGRRIGRPSFTELNPARWYQNAQSYTEGNPFLQPSFSYNFELNYSFKNTLQLGAYYNNTQNGFGQVTYHDINEETQIFKRLNYYNAQDIGLWSTVNFKPLSFWETTLDMSVFYKYSDNFIPLFDRDFSGWGGYGRTINNIFLNKLKTFILNVDYKYNLPGRNRETTYTAYSSFNIGLKGLFLDKKLTFGLNIEDLFKDNISTYSSISGQVQQSFTQYYDTRLIRLTLSYSIGNSKIQGSRRNIGNQEERNRAN